MVEDCLMKMRWADGGGFWQWMIVVNELLRVSNGLLELEMLFGIEVNKLLLLDRIH